MKTFVKTLILPVIFFISFSTANAQLKLTAEKSVAADIKKVIEDYPNHFDDILGELIVQNPQSSDYKCNFKVDAAEECIITRYTGKKNTISSWQALILTTDNFEEAKKKFKSLYNQLNNLSRGSMRLKGVYESPVEEKKFNSVLFSFDPPNEAFENLKVELVIESELLDWKVKLLVYDRDRDDNERGPVIEE